MKKILGIFVLITFLAACAPGAEPAQPTQTEPMTLPSWPSVPQNVNEIFYLTINGQPVDREGEAFLYQTDNFDLYLDLGHSSLLGAQIAGVSAVQFSLINKSSDRILVNWDETTFIDVHGSSSRVYHLGVRYADRNLSHPPTVVAPGARIDDVIVPSDYTEFDEEWIARPTVMLEDVSSSTFRVFLTLEVEGQRESLDIVFSGAPEQK